MPLHECWFLFACLFFNPVTVCWIEKEVVGERGEGVLSTDPLGSSYEWGADRKSDDNDGVADSSTK